MSTEHFDARAATWDDDPDKARRSNAVARALVERIPVGRGTRLLEYGAGTGLVTQALGELAEGLSVTLVDNSSGMRAVMEQKIAAGALPAEARIWDVDLEHQPPPAERFDLVVSVLVLHHVHDLDAVLRGFAALLDEGGHVAVADLDLDDGSFHEHMHDFDGHHGFDRGELAEAMERAGFTDVAIEDCTEIEKDGTAYPVFLATARRAPAAEGADGA